MLLVSMCVSCVPLCNACILFMYVFDVRPSGLCLPFSAEFYLPISGKFQGGYEKGGVELVKDFWT